MFSLSDLYNFLQKRVLKLSGGTMDSAATLRFPSETGDKIRLYGTTYGLSINASEFTIYFPAGSTFKLRDGPAGTVKGTVWHSGNDGAGSGLDADLLDGNNSAAVGTASTIALRDGNGHLTAVQMRSTIANNNGGLGDTAALAYRVNTGASNGHNFADRATIIAWLQAGGLGVGFDTVAHYTGVCDGVGSSTDVTITSVTMAKAYIVPTWYDDASSGITGYQLLSSTTVRIFHQAGHAGTYKFQVVSYT